MNPTPFRLYRVRAKSDLLYLYTSVQCSAHELPAELSAWSPVGTSFVQPGTSAPGATLHTPGPLVAEDTNSAPEGV
jgi:hypothetical protein